MSQLEQLSLLDETPSAGARFSACRTYRYVLWRYLTEREPRKICAFIGLNPSTADERTNDPTVTRCVNYATAWGFDCMLMLNAFALRATDPKNMLAADDPIGPDNDYSIAAFASNADRVVVCWGNHVVHRDRGLAVRQLLAKLDRKYLCFGLNKSGEPKHPLYLPSAASLVPFEPGVTTP